MARNPNQIQPISPYLKPEVAKEPPLNSVKFNNGPVRLGRKGSPSRAEFPSNAMYRSPKRGK